MVRNRVSYKDGWQLHINRNREQVVLWWSFFSADYTDPLRKVQQWTSREWHLPTHDLTADKLIKTAWLAVQQAELHEAAEAFQVNRIAVFDPHKEVQL